MPPGHQSILKPVHRARRLTSLTSFLPVSPAAWMPGLSLAIRPELFLMRRNKVFTPFSRSQQKLICSRTKQRNRAHNRFQQFIGCWARSWI